jgi:hypothetical protein
MARFCVRVLDRFLSRRGHAVSAAVAAASDDVAAASAHGQWPGRRPVLRQLSRRRPRSQSAAAPVPHQRQIGVGWASLRTELPPPAASATLTPITWSMQRSPRTERCRRWLQRERRRLLEGLFAAATEREQALLRRLLSGELR